MIALFIIVVMGLLIFSKANSSKEAAGEFAGFLINFAIAFLAIWGVLIAIFVGLAFLQ